MLGVHIHGRNWGSVRFRGRARAAALVLAGAIAGGGSAVAASPIATPIGVGPLFHPRAAGEAVLRAHAIGSHRCLGAVKRDGVHVELFARARVVIVPAGIGVAAPRVQAGAYVEPRGCSYAARTLEPTGVIETRRGSQLTLGDAFQIWGQPLSQTRLAGFATTRSAPVRAYVGGRRWHGPLRSIPLRRHAQIVLEVGRYIPPHRSFLFRSGL
jgi:hypothetical protein